MEGWSRGDVPEVAPILTVEMVRDIVRSQFPCLEPNSVEYLAEGGAHWMFLVDRQWVFRFPKDPNGQFPLLHEVGFLADIAPSLPVPVPEYHLLGVPGGGFPYRFAAYLWLPGVPAWQAELSDTARRTAAAQLGRMLGVLHAYDPARAREFGLWCDIELRAPAHTRVGAFEDLEAVHETVGEELYQRCLRFLRDDTLVPDAYAGAPCVVHGDLQQGHVLVAPESGAVTGVIDWADLQLGDPAMDFAILWAGQGDRFAEAMLDAYGLSSDPGLWNRLRYRGTCLAVEWVRFGTYGSPSSARLYRDSGLASLRRIFSTFP
jgi:aminoglycoside phosphotransferase (APT) family kinase protein